MDLHLELAPGEGRRDGLERALRDAVRDGRLAAGERLPATRRLAEELGVPRAGVAVVRGQTSRSKVLRISPDRLA